MKYVILLITILISLSACSNEEQPPTLRHQPAVDYQVYGKEILIDSATIQVDGIQLALLYYCKYSSPEDPNKMHIEAALKTSGQISTMAIYRKKATDKKHFISWSTSHNASSITGGKDFFEGMVIYVFAPGEKIEQRDESLQQATHTFILPKIDFPIPLYPEWSAVRN
jgi:hypothetical protein